MELEQRNLDIEELESETGHEVTETVTRQKNHVQQSLFDFLRLTFHMDKPEEIEQPILLEGNIMVLETST